MSALRCACCLLTTWQIILCGALAWTGRGAPAFILCFVVLHNGTVRTTAALMENHPTLQCRVALLACMMSPGTSAAGSQFIPMALSDVIDEDMMRAGRERRASTMFFGLNALVRGRSFTHVQCCFERCHVPGPSCNSMYLLVRRVPQLTKPAQSVAPMIVVWILSANGYHNGSSAIAAATGVAAPAPPTTTPQLANAAFLVLYGVPAVCGLVQLVLWSSHDLRGGRTSAAN